MGKEFPCRDSHYFVQWAIEACMWLSCRSLLAIGISGCMKKVDPKSRLAVAWCAHNMMTFFKTLLEDGCMRNPLHKQQSLPLRPIIPLVARISDQNASGAPPMTVREKNRLEKFRQLLSSQNTDLGESEMG